MHFRLRALLFGCSFVRGVTKKVAKKISKLAKGVKHGTDSRVSNSAAQGVLKSIPGERPPPASQVNKYQLLSVVMVSVVMGMTPFAPFFTMAMPMASMSLMGMNVSMWMR